jgi:hypothetical protein
MRWGLLGSNKSLTDHRVLQDSKYLVTLVESKIKTMWHPQRMILEISSLMERIGIETLVQRLAELLPKEKLTLEEARDKKVEDAMLAFDPTVDDDWKQFCFVDESVNYTRNLVAAGPDYDLILLCWNPKKRR